MRNEIIAVLSNWDASECAASVDDIATYIMDIVNNSVTDARLPESYETTCAYCGRPAHNKYGA